MTDYVLNCYNPNSSANPFTNNANSTTVWGATAPIQVADDWREARKILAKSCLNTYAGYQAQWFYADQWGVLPSDIEMPDGVETQQLQDGFDLLQTGDHVFAVQASSPAVGITNNSATSLVMYIYVTFQRTLLIAPDGMYFAP